MSDGKCKEMVATILGTSPQIGRLVEVYCNARTVKTGQYYTTINELTDQVPALRPDTLVAAASSIIGMGPLEGTKLLCEEDKGAVLGGLVSVLSSLPLAMARWYPYAIPGAAEVPVTSEYFQGKLYINGIVKGDRIVIVDDTLSTGGTIAAMSRAMDQMGAVIIDVRVVVEKLGNGGRRRIQDLLGIGVKAVIGIAIDEGGRVQICEVMGRSVKAHA